VLILPSPPHKFVGNEKDVQGFPRAMHQLELDPKCPARSVVFRDLICRMGRIAKLDPADRVRLTRSGELDKAMPISFRGVATGLFRIAAQYAREKNVGATYFAGSRAAEVAQAGCRIQQHMQYLLRLGDLCDEAGNTKLALTMLDDVTKAMESNGDELSAKSKEQVLAASRRRRIKWLGFLFESLMTPEHAQELWTLAKSQGGYAIGRRDRKVTAQCFSWMAVAAVLGGEYELAKEHAHDALLTSMRSRRSMQAKGSRLQRSQRLLLTASVWRSATFTWDMPIAAWDRFATPRRITGRPSSFFQRGRSVPYMLWRCSAWAKQPRS
jgi:hypothetical protein